LFPAGRLAMRRTEKNHVKENQCLGNETENRVCENLPRLPEQGRGNRENMLEV